MSEPLRVATGTPVVIDTSVAFKWFDTGEPGAAEAAALLRGHAADAIALCAPAHLPLEVVNAIACRGTRPEQIDEAISALADADLLIAPIDDELLHDGARIGFAEGMALYDAMFVALAVRLDAELVTADRRQAGTRSCRVRLIGA